MLRASNAVAKVAAEEGLDAEFRRLNLTELRSVLGQTAPNITGNK